jgi:MoxR-like ATPase
LSTPDLEASLLDQPGVSVADFRREDDRTTSADRRDGLLYRYSPEVKLAVRVALAIGRPLLVFGPSGCGKSSLVFSVARLLRRRYYEVVVSSRSEARDLYYRFDAVRRLGDAQLGAAAAGAWRSVYPFIEPGPLWWVFSPQSARWRGGNIGDSAIRPATDPGRWPDAYLDPVDRPATDEVLAVPAVLLIDEIDKADPDFANNLLVPLGSRQFVVEESGDLVKLRAKGDDQPPLVVITSNRERELPPAFVRRCVVLEIPPPSENELLEIAHAHFPGANADAVERWKRIAALTRDLRRQDPVSIPEYLDAVRAIEQLGGDETQWREILLRTAWTSDQDARP